MPTRIGRPSLFKNKQHRRTTFLSDPGLKALERHRHQLAKISGVKRPTDSDTIEFALLGPEEAIKRMDLGTAPPRTLDKAMQRLAAVTRAVRRPH